jgi:glycosyltransferase involved in cell wall biosynthesis
MNQSSPLRVAFLNTSMVVGGQERVLLDVVNGLDRNRFEPHVLLTKEPGPLADRFAKGVPVHHGLRKFKGDPLTLWRMWRWMRKLRPHVVFTFGAGDKLFYGRLAAALAGVPVIISGLHSTPGPEHRGRSIIGFWNRRLMFLNSAVVTVTDDLRDYLVQNEGFDPGLAHVIPNGVNCEDYQPRPDDPALRSSLGIPEEGPVAAIIAAVRPEKRHDLYIQTAARIVQEIPAARFLVVGDGPAREDFQRLARDSGVENEVLFLGARHDIPHLLGIVDAIVLPSTDVESSPICLLEALAAGVPQVASRIGGIPDIVEDGETGFLVEAGDIDGLVEHILTLFTQQEVRDRMAGASRNRALKVFSVEKMVQAHEALMEELVEARGVAG